MNTLCSFPKCRNLADLTYIGRAICGKHWNLLCEAGVGSKTEKGLLKKIGLVRNKSGAVIPIGGQNDEKD